MISRQPVTPVLGPCTYYKPIKVKSVEIEEALKAEHVLEVASDTQLCARTEGVTRANAPKDRNLVMLREVVG